MKTFLVTFTTFTIIALSAIATSSIHIVGKNIYIKKKKKRGYVGIFAY